MAPSGQRRLPREPHAAQLGRRRFILARARQCCGSRQGTRTLDLAPSGQRRLLRRHHAVQPGRRRF
eukprot:15632142-Heterocapsa_arctica.AAC.1